MILAIFHNCFFILRNRLFNFGFLEIISSTNGHDLPLGRIATINESRLLTLAEKTSQDPGSTAVTWQMRWKDE